MRWGTATVAEAEDAALVCCAVCALCVGAPGLAVLVVCLATRLVVCLVVLCGWIILFIGRIIIYLLYPHYETPSYSRA